MLWRCELEKRLRENIVARNKRAKGQLFYNLSPTLLHISSLALEKELAYFYVFLNDYDSAIKAQHSKQIALAQHLCEKEIKSEL